MCKVGYCSRLERAGVFCGAVPALQSYFLAKRLRAKVFIFRL